MFFAYAREMDVMTFGEEQAAALGVNLKRVKWVLMCAVAVLTGTAVSLVGIIGFVDLIAPHVDAGSSVLPTGGCYRPAPCSGALLWCCAIWHPAP